MTIKYTIGIVILLFSSIAYAADSKSSLDMKQYLADLDIKANCGLSGNEVSCFDSWKRLAMSGNGFATYKLFKIYDQNKFIMADGRENQTNYINKTEAFKYLQQAAQQGDVLAIATLRDYIPPKPYKWAVGMSKKQVLNSVDGEPNRKILSTVEAGTNETWFYTGAVLFFDERGLLSQIQEQQ